MNGFARPGHRIFDDLHSGPEGKEAFQVDFVQKDMVRLAYRLPP